MQAMIQATMAHHKQNNIHFFSCNYTHYKADKCNSAKGTQHTFLSKLLIYIKKRELKAARSCTINGLLTWLLFLRIKKMLLSFSANLRLP